MVLPNFNPEFDLMLTKLGVREQFLTAIRSYITDYDDKLDLHMARLNTQVNWNKFIIMAFNWETSDEGFIFWDCVYHQLSVNEREFVLYTYRESAFDSLLHAKGVWGKFIHNLFRFYRTNPAVMHTLKEYKNFTQFVAAAFPWEDYEGFDFWWNVVK